MVYSRVYFILIALGFSWITSLGSSRSFLPLLDEQMCISGVLGGVAVIYRQLPDHSPSDFIKTLEKHFESRSLVSESLYKRSLDTKPFSQPNLNTTLLLGSSFFAKFAIDQINKLPYSVFSVFTVCFDHYLIVTFYGQR